MKNAVDDWLGVFVYTPHTKQTLTCQSQLMERTEEFWRELEVLGPYDLPYTVTFTPSQYIYGVKL
jgi:hypothetical protein